MNPIDFSDLTLDLEDDDTTVEMPAPRMVWIIDGKKAYTALMSQAYLLDNGKALLADGRLVEWRPFSW